MQPRPGQLSSSLACATWVPSDIPTRYGIKCTSRFPQQCFKAAVSHRSLSSLLSWSAFSLVLVTMAFSMQLPFLPDHIPLSIYFVLAFGVFGLLYFINRTLSEDRPIKGFPIVALTEQSLNAKASWFKKGRETVEKGVSTYNGPFQVLTGTGPKICLPNHFAEEVKDLPELSFIGNVSRDFFATYPGFSAFLPPAGNDRFIPEVVRVKLTQSLGLVTNDLVDETTRAIHDLFGEEKEWRELVLKQTVQRLVARLSSRVFLGERLCRNERWLEIAKDYTVDAFIAAIVLRMVPSLLRPFLHWVIPQCRKVRKDYADAEKLITPEIKYRKGRAKEAMAAGQKVPKIGDMIGWMYDVAREQRESVNYVDGQLGLTLAAIHTTSEALSSTLLDIMEHPEIVEPLRKEVVDVIGQLGWSKQALYKLRLMDSVLRESQRIHELNYSRFLNMYSTTSRSQS